MERKRESFKIVIVDDEDVANLQKDILADREGLPPDMPDTNIDIAVSQREIRQHLPVTKTTTDIQEPDLWVLDPSKGGIGEPILNEVLSSQPHAGIVLLTALSPAEITNLQKEHPQIKAGVHKPFDVPTYVQTIADVLKNLRKDDGT